MNRLIRAARAARRDKGQSIVEISLMTPLLLVMLYIPADFGVAFFMGNLTSNAAREGARIGSGLGKTGGTGSAIDYSGTEAATVKTEVFARMPNFLTNKRITVKFYEGTGCMEFIEVTAQGDYNFFLYQVMNLFGGSIQNSVTISRTTQMRYNYQTPDNSVPCTSTTVNQSYTS